MNNIFKRLQGRYSIVGNCWVWLRPAKRGYGVISVNNKLQYVHRVSYQIHKGPIPEGMVVMHSCDNRACINPAHLSVGTQEDNLNDMRLKGRGSPPPRQGFGNRSPNHKLSEVEVMEIRRMLTDRTLKAKEIAAKFKVNPSAISKIKHGTRWGHSS